jgi:uncharacterized protein (TIGR03032 family)
LARDVLIGIEDAIGSNADDVLVGSVAANTLQGLGGDDTLQGGGGDDVLRGDNGRDLLQGGSGDDFLSGGAGNDWLVGGGGRDFLRGGEGLDTASYAHLGAGRGVEVRLGEHGAAGTAVELVDGVGDEASRDTLVEIEKVMGSGSADRLYGNEQANVIWTKGGADLVEAGAGNDYIVAEGLDFALIDGGAGTDTLSLSAQDASADLRQVAGAVTGIERISLRGASDTTLTLDYDSVMAITGGAGGLLAFTTYQAGKLFFLGIDAKGELAVFNRTLERCMGLAAAGDSLYVAMMNQVLRFENALEPGQATAEGYDRTYIPQVAWYTGDLDAHDLALDGEGRAVFVNTLFSCLATVSETHSFAPIWHPPFITKLAAEDRCHLNGLALDATGRPAYVTAVAATDVADGWRDHREAGGLVLDVASGEPVCAGLSMPHSPRLHEGTLYVLNSGTGEFGTVDPQSGAFEPIAFCPGYLRGLAFIGGCAVIGLSKARENRTFAGLALDARLEAEGVEARCGLYVIDLKTGDVAHHVRIGGVITELYDIVALPGARNPMAIGFRSEEIRRVLSVGSGPG